jgi:hypothetical protein
MSGYLQRLAARSVGSPGLASALPRLPARFEQPALAGLGLEVADERLTSHGAPAAPASHAAGNPRSVGRRLDPGSALRRPGERRPTDTPASAPRRAVVAASPATTAPVAGEPAAGAAATGALDPAAAVGSSPPTAAIAEPAPSAEPVARVTAQPAGRARAPLAAERRDARAAQQAASQPPVVRVHIGRLEVRANVQPAPAAAPAAADPGPAREQLALSAYLRGERQAR